MMRRNQLMKSFKLTLSVRMKNYFLNNYKIFSSSTHMHGFAELYKSKSAPGKLLWILALIFCFGITTYQLTNAVKEYVNVPYRTVIEKINEEDLFYPYFRICYNHWMYWADFEKAFALGFTRQSFLFGMSYLSDVYVETSFNVTLVREQFLATMANNTFKKLSEFYKAVVRSTPSEFFTDITFFDNILCYGVNSTILVSETKHYHTIDEAKKDDLQVYFEIDNLVVNGLEKGVLSKQEHDCNALTFLDRGFFMGVRPKKEFFSQNYTSDHDVPLQLPIYLMIDWGLVEVRWDDAFLLVHSHATVSRWQNTTTMSCVKGKISLISDKTCMESCHQNYKSKICVCSWFREVSFAELDYVEKLCTNKIHFISTMADCVPSWKHTFRNVHGNSLTNCTLTVLNDFCCDQSSTETQELSLCVANCVPGCTIWNYYLGNVQRVTLGTLKRAVEKTYTGVLIYLPTINNVLSTNEIDNQSIENIVGNIGGILGVWTGASILTVLQLIYLCCCNELSWAKTRNINRADTVTSRRDNADSALNMED